MTSATKPGSGGFLSQMQFKRKMLIMVALPLLVLTWFAASDIQDNWVQYNA